MKRKAVRIGITIGDPAGIGAEVSLRAVNCLKEKSIIPVIIGRSEFLANSYPQLFTGYRQVETTDQKLEPGYRYVYNVNSDMPLPVPGSGSPDTGRESLSYIDKGLDLWKDGFIDALATAPVNKGFIQMSGISFTGHTEYIADKTGGKNPLMLMFSPLYRVIPVTTHIPVSEIGSRLNIDKIKDAIVHGSRSIEEIDGKPAKIAVAGLDPHCGDNGAINSFDRDVTGAAVEYARNQGVDVDGPLPADTLFIPHNWKKYSLAIAMYHDQGLIPFKVVAFEKGVNVTLGLKIVRTSADHGTAYGIAGSGTADHRSMLEAIRLAYRLVLNKKN